MKVSGKSKLYSPTEAGKKYIPQQLNEFKFVFQQILETGLLLQTRMYDFFLVESC